MSSKQAILKLAKASGLAAVARRATAGRLRILCYHGLWVTPGHQFGDCLFISPEQFEARMARVARSGLPVLPLGEAVERLGADSLPDGALVITIDDAWVSTFTHMLPVLERYRLPATLYATTWYAGQDLPVVNVAIDYLLDASGRRDLDRDDAVAKIEALPTGERLDALRHFGAELRVPEAWLETRQFNIMSGEELVEARRRGLDVQLHTHRHIDVAADVDSLPREIDENRAFLEAAGVAGPFDHFCYPSGASHERAAELLAAGGVRSATLVDQGINPPGADPFALRRFLDARHVGEAEFDAYLSGLLHYLAPVQRLRALLPG
ncbi:MAG TPA: polysaccharide deacetylase family protein [Allosphingosinicella sp.]|nr:polysaccharide deacetylase family protein [Allosphingosinicella sp.]